MYSNKLAIIQLGSGAMKVKVRIEQTGKGLQAWVIQEGRRGDNLIKRHTKSTVDAKAAIFTKLSNCEVEFEFVGVEE